MPQLNYYMQEYVAFYSPRIICTLVQISCTLCFGTHTSLARSKKFEPNHRSFNRIFVQLDIWIYLIMLHSCNKETSDLRLVFVYLRH